MNISHHINSRIEDLSNAGSDLADANQFDKAASKWSEALGLLPDPKSDWEAATWLLASIGDALYQQGKWDEARTALYDALNCPDGQSNPFIHYRLGQCEPKGRGGEGGGKRRRGGGTGGEGGGRGRGRARGREGGRGEGGG